MIRLTVREHQVWQLIRLSKKQTAAYLGISPASVSSYRRTLYAELGVDTAVDAALLAVAFRVVVVESAKGTVTIKTTKAARSPICETPNCGRPHRRNGLCHRCSQRVSKPRQRGAR